MDFIEMINKNEMRDDIPAFKPGDTVQVHYRIVEGSRERVQVFEGTVIKKQGGGSNETFTVRRISYGVGVERIFLLHFPRIEQIKVVRRDKVRLSKLYYLRQRQGRSARIREKQNY